jgi:[glutamine synthetase] adenylyltransferase / [glutamine synthetase]-adenylyl-L-tyrosine phosphorylase
VTSPEVLGRALAAAPDPELARVALSRVGERSEARELLSEPEVVELAAPLLGFSTAVTDFLVAHPEEAALFADVRPRTRDELLAEARTDSERHGFHAGLRRFRRRALYRVAARDLGGAPLDGVVDEVTLIAESCLEIAAAEEGLAVIGLGKLGGAELNYASDVDVVFVHREAGADSQDRGGRAGGRIISLLSEPTAEGVALRVDAALRPEGRSGPLSRSLEATVEYYRRHAATWERQAWIKARPAAGDRELGAELIESLEPVIYPEHLEVSAIEDVRAMKVRIEEYVRASGKDAVEVKRGRGGIRDVEFAVQLLQLVHGRRDPSLREPNTLRALSILAHQGYVAVPDADAMAASYRFLRALEHRLQLAREVQTHELPADDASLLRLARSMGLEGSETLHAEHERLFYRPLLEAFAGARVPRPGRERAATEELLGGLGFADPRAAYRRFEALVDPATRLGRVLAHVFPVVAPALALAADPDAAVVRLQRVAEGLGSDEEIADLLAGDSQAARRLARVVGASSWLADALAANPRAVRPAIGAREPENAAERLLVVGGAYAAGELAVPASGHALAEVADRVIAEAVEEASPSVGLAVIGLGKLGGGELNFASDLDVMFVYEGEGAADFEEAERTAEAVLTGIRARGFEADPDLRPEGRSGPLARSMAAYLEYWQRHGQTWEFQALLKARPVAGEQTLGRRFARAAEDFAYPEALPVEKVAEIRRMRVRIEEERVRPPDARRFHFKLGYGGLADVQFAVELSLLRHGGEHPDVRHRHTLDALEALARERLIEDSVSLALGEAYVFLNEIKNAMEIDRRLHAEALPPALEAQVALARRLGYEEFPRAAFLEDYRRITRRARRAMERVFYPDDEA